LRDKGGLRRGPFRKKNLERGKHKIKRGPHTGETQGVLGEIRKGPGWGGASERCHWKRKENGAQRKKTGEGKRGGGQTDAL